jgi:hypothetical protein
LSMVEGINGFISFHRVSLQRFFCGLSGYLGFVRTIERATF